LIRHGIRKKGNGDVYVGFFLLMGLIAAFTEGAFTIPKVKFSQNIFYPHGSEGVNIEQVLPGPSGYPGGQSRKIVDGSDFLMFGIDKASGQLPKVKPAAVRMGMLEGAVIEVKAVYVNAYPGFTIFIKIRHGGGSFKAASLRIGPV
jgi:hypothetical protein